MKNKKDYVRFSDLPLEEQNLFWEFLAKTARSRPIGEGDCAWLSDYEEFNKVGADPYACLRASEQYAGKLRKVVEKKRYQPGTMRCLTVDLKGKVEKKL